MTRPRDDERYSRVAESQLDKLVKAPEAISRLQQAPKAKLSTLIRGVGATRATAATRQRLQDAFDAKGIETVPALDDPGLGPDDWVRFVRSGGSEDFASSDQLFETEYQLRRYLKNNPGAIRGFGRLTLLHEELKLHTGQRVDLVFIGRSSVHIVVELKVATPDARLPSQMHQYLEAYQAELRRSGNESEVKGLIVTGQPDYVLADEVKTLCSEWEVRWMLYRRTFTMKQLD